VSEAIGRHTPTRERIYRVLLGQPHREWTVRTLTATAGTGISASAVRDTIYLLVAAAAMTVLPGNQALTVRLTADGLTRLQSIDKDWRRSHPGELRIKS
jgi:hypothetical protein